MSLGTELKALREKSGLSIEELSEQTHIGTHILSDLETGDFGHIRAAIYGSGFVKILAKHYGIDGTSLRETFNSEYKAWVVANTSAPAPKKAPQKFTNHRVGAKPAPGPSAPPPPQPERRSPQSCTPIPESRGTPAPAPAATREATAANAAPDLLDNAAGTEEPLGGLFEGIESPVPKPQPQPQQPAADVPRPSVGDEDSPSIAERRAPQTSYQDAAPLRDTPTELATAPAPENRKPRRPALDMDEIRASLRPLIDSVAGVVRTPLFQRIVLAAVAVALSAWVCTLFIGGGQAEPQSPQPAPEPAPQAIAEPQEPPPTPAVRIHFTGSALTDNLLPPPDCYAE